MVISPIGYTLANVPNPFQAIQQGLAAGQGLAATRQNQQQIDLQRQQLEMQQRAAQAAAATKAQRDAQVQAFNRRITAPGYKLTQADIIEALSLLGPEATKVLQESANKMSEQERSAAAKRYGQVFSAIHGGRPDIAESTAREYAEALKNSGDEAGYKAFVKVADQIKANPNGAGIMLGGTLYGMGDQGKSMVDGILAVKKGATEEAKGALDIEKGRADLTQTYINLGYASEKAKALADQEIAKAEQERAKANVAPRVEEAKAREAEGKAVITEAEAGTAGEMQKAKLAEYQAKAAREAVLAKFEESKQVQEAAIRGANLKVLEQEPEIRKQNQALAVMENKLKSEANAIRRQELQQQITTKKEERDAAIKQKMADADAAVSVADNAIATMDKALAIWDKEKDASWWRRGPVASATGAFDSSSWVPTFFDSTADFQELVKNMQAQVFLTQIPNMKGAGALSDAEGKKLDAAVRSLSMRQSPEELMGNIAEIRRLTEKGKAGLAAKFGVGGYTPPTETSAAPASPAARAAKLSAADAIIGGQ